MSVVIPSVATTFYDLYPNAKELYFSENGQPFMAHHKELALQQSRSSDKILYETQSVGGVAIIDPPPVAGFRHTLESVDGLTKVEVGGQEQAVSKANSTEFQDALKMAARFVPVSIITTTVGSIDDGVWSNLLVMTDSNVAIRVQNSAGDWIALTSSAI